jgi:hypothetical protein
MHVDDDHAAGNINAMDEDELLLFRQNEEVDLLPFPSKRVRRSQPSGTPMHPLALPPKKRICLDEIYPLDDGAVHSLENSRIYNPSIVAAAAIVASVSSSPNPKVDGDQPKITYGVAPISNIDTYSFIEILSLCNWPPTICGFGPSVYYGLNVAAKFALCGDSSMHKILSNLKPTELTPLTIHMGDFKQPHRGDLSGSYGRVISRRPQQNFTLLDYLNPMHVRIAFHRLEVAPASTWTDCTKSDYKSMVHIISSLPSCVVSLEYPRDDACIGVSRLFNMICHNSSFHMNLERLVIGVDLIPAASLSFEHIFNRTEEGDDKLPSLHTLIITNISEMGHSYGMRKLPVEPPYWTGDRSTTTIHQSYIPASVRIAHLHRYKVQLDTLGDAARFGSLRAHSISLYERVRNDYVIYQ